MSSIIIQENPVSGKKYAYESISYWDKQKKAPRSKRKYLGRIDEETGEIIPKKPRHKNAPSDASTKASIVDLSDNSTSHDTDSDFERNQKNNLTTNIANDCKDALIQKLMNENDELRKQNRFLESIIQKISQVCEKAVEK